MTRIINVKRGKGDNKGQAIACPFTVQVDTREQAPYLFSGMRSNVKEGNRLITVPLEFRALETGDYSIVGMNQVVVERKSKSDLYGSVARRENFKGRLERMTAIANAGGYAAIVVESDVSDTLRNPPPHSKLDPKSLNRTIIAWRQRYRADWYFVSGREDGEAFTFRILERFWLDHQEATCTTTQSTPGNSSAP